MHGGLQQEVSVVRCFKMLDGLSRGLCIGSAQEEVKVGPEGGFGRSR